MYDIIRNETKHKHAVPLRYVSFQAWKKFGAASNDQPGPNPANTIMSEEIYMQFVHSKDVSQHVETVIMHAHSF